MKFTRTGIAALAVLVIAATALVLTSIGSAKPAKTAATPFKMAIVTDIGSLQDRSFNQLANEGRKKIGKKLGIATRVYETHSESERIPNMLAASEGRLQPDLRGRLPQLHGARTLSRRSSRRFAMPGSMSRTSSSARSRRTRPASSSPSRKAATWSATSPVWRRRRRASTRSAPSERTTCPRSSHYISGYIQGAKKANPGIKVLANYANDPTFNDQAKCHETALNQINQGSHVVFQVAGGCGLGALQAAKENKVWGIGVDADQRYLGPHIMTSALKKVDKAVEDLTTLAKQGKLKTGKDYVFSLKNGGMGLGSISPKIPKAYVTKTTAIAKQIASGKIKVKAQVKF